MKTFPPALVIGVLLLPQLCAAPIEPGPRLVGIVRLPERRVAILEIVSARSGVARQVILSEGQREGDLKVLQIDPETSVVQLSVARTNVLASLDFTQQTNHATVGVSSVMLARAGLDSILNLYAELKGRTLLRSPRLPAISFSLNFSTTNAAQTALMLEKVLAEKGIATIPDGQKFVMVVPAAEATTVKPHSSEIKSGAAPGEQTEPISPGAINFVAAPLNLVAQVYAGFIGCKLEPDSRSKLPVGLIRFQNLTPLSKKECLYALETLFRWQGIKVIPTTQGMVRLAPVSDPEPAPDK